MSGSSAVKLKSAVIWRQNKTAPIYIQMSVRAQKLALADHRALEEQAERVNPIAPSLRGKGATPSMGLSQFRGGKKSAKALNAIIDKDEADHPSLYIKEMDEEAEMPSGEYDGAGDARAQGAALASHLKSLRGGAFHAAFLDGMSGKGVDYGRYEGEGKLEIVHHGDGAMKGGSSHMVGGAKKPKREVGASDARRKRAEIVKKVMAEKGMKMIEASKYVKAHNLY
jgi:hypothetical protein